MSGEPLEALGEAHIVVNSVAAARFGLVVSPKVKELADVQ